MANVSELLPVALAARIARCLAEAEGVRDPCRGDASALVNSRSRTGRATQLPTSRPSITKMTMAAEPAQLSTAERV
eukprot:4816129-Pyramimonas_sp.AAC.1